MKKQRNVSVKIIATIALLAIIIGIVGTGVLVVSDTLFRGSNQADIEISNEQLQEYLDSLSGSTTLETSTDIEVRNDLGEQDASVIELESQIEIENNIGGANSAEVDVIESISSSE